VGSFAVGAVAQLRRLHHNLDGVIARGYIAWGWAGGATGCRALIWGARKGGLLLLGDLVSAQDLGGICLIEHRLVALVLVVDFMDAEGPHG
jgi:hypothetical protein